MCHGNANSIVLTLLVMTKTFGICLVQMLVLLSLYVIVSLPLSILVCVALSLFCACLVSVHFSESYCIDAIMRCIPVYSGR